jgi:two-component system sensor histidine kinase SenX3
VDPALAVGAAAGVGALTGAAGVLAFRLSERQQAAAPPVPEPVLPPGRGARARRPGGLGRRARRVGPGPAGSAAAHRFGLVAGDRLLSEPLLELARRTRRDGEIRTRELELPRGPLGGETLAVSARVAPLGESLVLLLVDDRSEARRIDSVRRDFVANVSHELKTPVGALILLAEAVLGASDEPDAVRRFAGRMQHEASRLSDLVQELIDLSRLQWQDPLREPSDVDVDSVVVDAIDRCRTAALAKSIELVTGGEEGMTVLGDEEQLVMALRNLIDNAISYSAEHTRVAVGVRRRKDLVELSVTDQGIGIPEPDLERIFERFYRVDPARSRATGGTGLGLSIVKHVAGNHGGEVTVWSAEGSGSTFTIRLPIRAGLSATVNPIGPALSRGYLSGPANGTGHHYRTAREATP